MRPLALSQLPPTLLFPTEEVDAKDRIRKRYRYEDMMPPYDKLKPLPNATCYLKPGFTFRLLDAIAYAISDNEAAQALNEVRAQWSVPSTTPTPSRLNRLTATLVQAHSWIGKD